MKQHTNKHLRRALALFMTVLMAMSCVSAGLVASASVSGFPTRENLDWFTASNDTMYGVDPWDGTTGKETINSTGFGSHWNTGSYTADNFCTVEYPGAIYLNVGESLQAAGYKVHMTAHYGNKRDHRIMINSLIWGETKRSGYNGVYNLIPDYDHLGTVSEGISVYPDTTTSTTDFDFANDAYGANNLPSSGEGFEGEQEKMIVWRVPYDNETVYNFDEYVFLKGTAAQTGTYTFSTGGVNPLLICAQDWQAYSYFSSDAKVLKDDLTSSTVMDGQWKELRINFTVYDKTDLNKAVAYADAYYAANGEYPVKEGQTQQQFADALTQAKSVLATREVTQTQIDYAFNSICDRMTTLIIDNADAYTAGGDPFGTDANTFNAVAYHCADPATGTQNWQKTNGFAHDYEELKWGVYGNAYRNLAYAPYDDTLWTSEKEYNNSYTTFATPSNVVMVYDGADGHAPMSPIMLQRKGKGGWNGSDARAVDYVAVADTSLNLQFQRQWAGYMDESNDGYKQWPDVADGRNTVTVDANSYINYQVRDRNDLHRLQTSNQSNKDTRRDYGNAFVYVGTGNNEQYYELFTETAVRYSHTWYAGSNSVDAENINTKGNIYVINYKPVYDKLADAAAAKAIIDNADEVWKYTGASVERAKATLAVMAKANPNAYAYSDVGGDVQTCASYVEKAVYMLANDGLTLEKKSGTATFLKDDGTTEVAAITAYYGDTFTVPAVPEKEETAQYTYTDGVWTPAATPGSAVMSDDYNKTFTASYTPNLRSYTITWNYKNAEGPQTETDMVHYGETPVPPVGSEANYQTNTLNYTFSNWSPAIVAVAGEKNYVAQYSSTPRTYSITYKDGDTVLTGIEPATYTCGTGAAINGTYSKAGYTFNGWKDENGDPVTTILGNVYGDITLYADLTIHQHNIIWKNGDETIKTDANQNYGTQAVWSDAMPTTADAQYTYTAIGWNTDPDATTALDTLPTLGDEDLTLYAIYDKNDESNRTVNKYTVTFYAEDGKTVLNSDEYEYGTAVANIVVPTAPDKAEDAVYTYEFDKWTPELASVTADADYTATYKATAKTAIYTNMDAALEKADAALAAAGITDDVKTAIETAVATAKQTAYNKDGEGNYTVQKTLDEENAQQKVDNAAAALMNAIQAYFDIDETTGAVTPKDAALKTLTVTWKNGEATVGTATVKYGKAVDSADIPDAPADDYDATKHYTYAWADTDLSAVTENKTVLAVATGTAHSFSAEWTWAEDASTATVALSCDCGYSETQNGTVSQKSHTNGTCLAKETTVYTATYGAYTAPDKTVEGDYGDHVYNAEYDQLIRPVKDENGTWSNGTKIWYCQTVGGTSNDEHNKTASVARANYDAFDELIAKVQGYLEQDITDEFRTAINNVLGMDEIKNLPDNLIVDEQTQVDAAVTILNAAYAQAKEGGILDEDGNITDNGYKHYTITFVTDGSAVESITGAKKGDEITLPETAKDGFHFEGWYTDETHADGTKAADPYTVTGDVTLYAFFEELSLNGDDVEAAIAAATAGVSGICYTEESYTAYTNAVAAVRAFKDQSATTENLTAYNNALAALDAAVAALVVEHAYTGQPAITRPVYDEATGTWSKGVKTWTCANNADHPVRTEEVDRADYATYDSVLEQISDLLDEDLTDDVKTALEEAKTALEAIPQNYITDEQATLDNAIQEILDTLKGNDKIDVDENNSITVDPDTAYKTYTLKLTNNVNTDYMEFTQKAGTTAHLNPGLSGYTLKGFSENANYNAETGIYTFPQRDDTITALYVKDLTDNEAITDANAIISDENDPDSGKDYDDDYIDDLNDLLDDIDAIKDDPTKIDELNEKLEDLQALVDKAEENRAYTITWSIDGVETTETYKVGDTPTHEDPTKEGFRFTGWEPAIVAVSGDATYTAVFTEISAEPADYSEYDALFEKLGTVVTNDVITDELKQEAQDKLDHPLDRDLTADQQQIIDDEVAAIKAILDKIFEKDGNGDYTDTVKDSAAIHYNVVFHWLDVTLTKTVVKGSGVSAPNVTEMYGVEGEANGHYVFDKWDKDFSNVTEDIDVYGSYKLADHTGAWIDHPATCSRYAYKEITCTTCGLHFEVNTGDTLADHDWNDWLINEATCAHPGSKTRTCKNDPSHTEFEVIPQLPHTDANGDTICDVCGNPTENHQHTDVNGDGKCDTCGAPTNVHSHNDANGDGVCDGCGRNIDGSFRCNMCPVWERYRSIPVAGWILTAIHFFYHLICQIVSWR